MLQSILRLSTRCRFAVGVNAPTFMPFADEALPFASGWFDQARWFCQKTAIGSLARMRKKDRFSLDYPVK